MARVSLQILIVVLSFLTIGCVYQYYSATSPTPLRMLSPAIYGNEGKLEPVKVVPTLNRVEALYTKYSTELNQLWNFMHLNFCSHEEARSKAARPGLRSQCTGFGTLETELLYMQVRESKPKHILEVSPQKGYSSFIMLYALHRNGMGELHSFDLEDSSQTIARKLLPDPLKARWHFTIGNVQKTLLEYRQQQFGFIFIDSLHTEEFAHWYVNTIYPNMKSNDTATGRTHFYTHDIFCLPYCMRYGNKELQKCTSNLMTLDQQYQCTKAAGWNPAMAFREGTPLLAHYANTPGSTAGLTLSYFRDPMLVNSVIAKRKELGIKIQKSLHFVDSPGFYFEVQPLNE